MKVLQRLLFLLLAANLLLLLWNLVRPATGSQEMHVSQRAVDPLMSLIHISEQSPLLPLGAPADPDSSQSSPGASPAQRVESLLSSCLVLGPFISDEVARAAMSDSGLEFSVKSLRESVPESPLYRAMIPPSSSREEALLRLSEVNAVIERVGRGIDTYLVTSGPIANAVSLGVFSDQSNALNVQSLLVAEGVDVVIEQENRTEVRYWVVVNNAQDIDITDLNSYFQEFEEVPEELSENLCETIAQAE